jgi:hypothetical protein
MNSYNIFDSTEPSTILFNAIAKDHAHVEQLAQEAGIDITGYSIELERVNVKNQLGKPFEPSIKDALVHS